jgi:hypothetical protein
MLHDDTATTALSATGNFPTIKQDISVGPPLEAQKRFDRRRFASGRRAQRGG